MALDKTMPILVVDDYKTMLRIIRNLLHQLGFENVEQATDGAAALAKLEQKRYGLVISDWNMQPMSGLELLERVRATPGLAPLPFIMISAESKRDRMAAAERAGVSGYIVKPFNAETLQSQIASVMGA